MTRYMVDKMSLEQTFNEVVQGGSWRVAAAVAQHLRQHDPQVGRCQRHRHRHGGGSGAQENQTDVQLPESCDFSFESCKRTADLYLECIFVQVDECDDTDSNKTEVEEIEMVDMEGRAEVALFSYSVPLSCTKMK